MSDLSQRGTPRRPVELEAVGVEVEAAGEGVGRAEEGLEAAAMAEDGLGLAEASGPWVTYKGAAVCLTNTKLLALTYSCRRLPCDVRLEQTSSHSDWTRLSRSHSF